MAPSQIILQEPIPWWFYVFMVVFLGVVGWFGFLAFKRVRALFLLGPFRKLAKEAGVSSKAVSVMTWVSVIVWSMLFIISVCGTWVIVRDNFCSFRQLDVSGTNVRLTYEWSFLNRDVSLSSLRDIRLDHIIRGKFGLEIATTDGKVYRSVNMDDEAIISDCRSLTENFLKNRSNKTDGQL